MTTNNIPPAKNADELFSEFLKNKNKNNGKIAAIRVPVIELKEKNP